MDNDVLDKVDMHGCHGCHGTGWELVCLWRARMSDVDTLC